jgi:hypothetical protein
MDPNVAAPTDSGVAAAPAAGDGGVQSAAPAAPGAAAPAESGSPQAPAPDLNLSDREKAFLSGLKDEREKRQAIEQENALLKANAPQQWQPPQQQAPQQQAPAAPADPFDGIDDDDIMTAKDIKSKIMPHFMGMIQQIAGAMAVQQRAAQFTDVTNDDIRAFVPKIIQEDPALAQVLQVLPGPAQFILAQTLARYAKKASGVPGTPASPPAGTPPAAPASDPLSEIARAILANAQKPGAPGSAGGGAMDDVVSLLRTMTPEQYEVYRAEKRKGMGLT